MCRCCQSCWEDIYWNCIEEKYCYDETIANYNPEDDEQVGQQKAVGLESHLRFPNSPITTQPISTDDDFRREIQTNVNVLAPEILAVFKNSLIFQEQPKIMRSSVISGVERQRTFETDEQKLIKRLEAPSNSSPPQSKDELDNIDDESKDEVVLRPKFARRHQLDLPLETIHQKQPLRNVQSFPHLNSLDVFTISHSESMSRISMTPEVPSISMANLPKNYEDTPTIEKFRASTSLYSIQTANEAKATEKNEFSMPRYYRKSGMVGSPSVENFQTISEESLPTSHRQLAEKSQRLQIARLQLPPLHIRQKKDDSKNIQ